jgi:hypothetical protein
MITRFLKYSLERETKICVVLMQEGAMKKTNLRVTAIEPDGAGFLALLPGRKKETRFLLDDVLTATYARGDKGELE